MRTFREDLRVPDAEADLYLVGLGIGGFDQRSVEVDQLLREASLVLHLTAFHDEIEAVAGGFVENLTDRYFAGQDARSTYAALTNHIVDSTLARRGLGPTLFLTYGHPLFLVDTSWALLDDPRLRVKAIAASSFLDRLLGDVGARFDYGVQMYEANAYIRERPRIDNRFGLVISQVGEVGSDEIAERGRKLEWLQPLFAAIVEDYPHGRRSDLVFSPYRADMAPQVASASVGQLQTLLSSVHTGSTLFVHGN